MVENLTCVHEGGNLRNMCCKSLLRGISYVNYIPTPARGPPSPLGENPHYRKNGVFVGSSPQGSLFTSVLLLGLTLRFPFRDRTLTLSDQECGVLP